MPFYNTTKETKTNLKAFEQKAKTQDEIIKEIFKRFYGGLTAVEVMYKFPDKRTPLTSIRRSLSNLSDAGYLVKTEFKKDGLFGRGNYIYKLNTGQLTLFQG